MQTKSALAKADLSGSGSVEGAAEAHTMGINGAGKVSEELKEELRSLHCALLNNMAGVYTR